LIELLVLLGDHAKIINNHSVGFRIMRPDYFIAQSEHKIKNILKAAYSEGKLNEAG